MDHRGDSDVGDAGKLMLWLVKRIGKQSMKVAEK